MITLERQSILSQEISAADSRPRWLQVVQGVAKEFGYSYASLMRVPRPEEQLLATALVETTLPIRFVREFDEMRLLGLCPVLPKIKHSVMPQSWSLSDLDTGQPEVLPIVELLNQFGIANGLIIPTNSLNGDRHLMRFDGKCDLPSQVALNEIGMIALHAFDAYEQMRRSEMVAPRMLTKRELEVIHWTSQGKTSAEIGKILSLSDHTINAYLNNAIRKLDCVNRTQLVAKSIRLKLIG
ncbi:helix-turn-helix transcriptional regulator [Agrobacterium rosae]|uniref:LuxR C-terminal-related transcriptional regulator n=1 Tax=Agrobacterium rosae TaxID=1972867 RepID=A0AAE5S128_9HYPH|nr:LuxR family transcriptional regulator [Agrobacterium rosae]KAA3513288.1 LuxR family transcriptional regulator [Agrobacterium rosae]KAA3521229.1 LuxR family transcriptional regulator [Agrobacterium rosae]MBN7805900.1 LuxR family transcriptional regulator [Agrobacterium rosae]MCM2432946.1 LuxR family transcriptional regulator [Agrobacterium rosae]MDX8327985.1 LuxR C-terminal-related transcriptional regulator [Agrobacterium rosae]